MATAGEYWVTWPRDAKNGADARAQAIIWGPQADPPPQLSDMFLAGSFLTLAAAQAYKNAIGTGSIIPTPGTPIVGSGPGAPRMPKITDPLQAIGDFFAKLGQPNLWIRIGEALLGIVLIGVGLAHLTGVDNVINKAVGATPVGRVAKVARA
jgi:hypothetical protein